MRKIGNVILAVILMVGPALPAFAAKKHASQPQKPERIVAHVVTLDVPGRTIGITEEKSGASRTIHISAKAASQLKVGDRVRIKLKPGTNESLGVLVLKAQPPVDQTAPDAMTTVPANEATAQ